MIPRIIIAKTIILILLALASLARSYGVNGDFYC